MASDGFYVWANIAECGLWSALAGAALIGYRRRGLGLCLALLAFGVSDLVETRTGAWYRPWWLLAWKASCVVLIPWLAIRAGGQDARPTR